MRVLVVDDEPIMRDAYAALFDWEKNGFTLAGSVHNGKVALEFMRSNPVDIVITDLKMPVMSGLEFIRLAKEEFPRVRFIVMSGYDEFHMVKEAYNLGVKEYFLKIELDPDEILQTLLKIKNEIIGNNISDQHKKENAVQKEKLLKNLIWGADANEASKLLGENGISINRKEMCVLVLSIPNYYAAEEKLWHGERELFKYAILNVLEEICVNHGGFHVFCNLPNEFVAVCNFSGRQALDNFFDDVRLSVRKCFDAEIDCGLSSVVNSYGDLKAAYRQAVNACAYSFVTGHGRLIDYNELRFFNGDVDVAKGVFKMKNLLRSGDGEKIRNGAFGLRISPNNMGYDKTDKIKNLFYLYYIEMVNFIAENGLEDDIVENVQRYDSIKDSADLSQMNDWLIKSVFEVADALAYRSGVYKAISYIKNHYSEQITLSFLANLLDVSDGHLSRMFQKTLGMSFTQYLIKVRMETAAHLLKNENLKIYEVAMKVGYPNAEQFSRMFKKVVGKSPKEFQK